MDKKILNEMPTVFSISSLQEVLGQWRAEAREVQGLKTHCVMNCDWDSVHRYRDELEKLTKQIKELETLINEFVIRVTLNLN